jgi:hypothetical protein
MKRLKSIWTVGTDGDSSDEDEEAPDLYGNTEEDYRQMVMDCTGMHWPPVAGRVYGHKNLGICD